MTLIIFITNGVIFEYILTMISLKLTIPRQVIIESIYCHTRSTSKCGSNH